MGYSKEILEQILGKLTADEWNGTREHAKKILDQTVNPNYCNNVFTSWANNLQLSPTCPTVLCADCTLAECTSTTCIDTFDLSNTLEG